MYSNFYSICNLYKWRYKKLGNLSHVETWPEYKRANAGFAYDFQLIDVGDFNGVGESEPNPYFYQVSKLFVDLGIRKRPHFSQCFNMLVSLLNESYCSKISCIEFGRS